MTQDEKWLLQYEQMMAFMNEYQPAQIIEKFAALMEIAIKFRRINQYE